MFISKVEDIDPVTALYYDVFTSIIMPNDWSVANWIILSYGNLCSWVIFTQYWFCWIPVCSSLWSIQTTFLVYRMYEKALDFLSIYDYFSSLFPELTVFTFFICSSCCHIVCCWEECRGSSSAVKTPFFQILLLNLSTYWQWYYTGLLQKNNLHP